MTARSLEGSRLISLTSYSFSSAVITLYLASRADTTCLFVTINPSASTIKPVPISCSTPPSNLELTPPPKGLNCKILLLGVSIETVTTEGEALSTISTTPLFIGSTVSSRTTMRDLKSSE